MKQKTTSYDDIHTTYVGLGVELIHESRNLTQDRPQLSFLLTELQKEYIIDVFAYENKTLITEREAKNKSLLSSDDLKQRLISDIASQLHLKVSNLEVAQITNAEQLLDALQSPDICPIPQPDIQGTVENI